MQIDSDPLKVEEAHFVKPLEIMMVNIGEGLDKDVEEVSMLGYIEKMKVVYPKVEEELIDFLNRFSV